MRLLLSTLLSLSFTVVLAQDKSLLVNSGKVIEEGSKYHDDGKYDKAIYKYKQVSESDTNYTLALYEMTITYFAQENYTSAIETATKGLALPSSLRASLIQQLGNAYSGNKQLDKALETYRNGLAEFPYYFRFYYEMGAACFVNKQPKLALVYIDSCLKINFGYGRAHYLMGLICEDNNYFIPAILSFQMASYLAYTDDIGFKSLMAIQKIANGETRLRSKDSIVQLFPKDENNFEEIDEIIRSKSELVDKYKVKPKVKLPFTSLIKCLHLVNSRLGQYANSKGWYADNLLPIYIEWWAHKDFPVMLYRMCYATQSEECIKIFTKNKDKISEQYNTFFETHLKKRQTYKSRLPFVKGEYRHLFLYKNSNLYAIMPADESYNLEKGLIPKEGHYIFYHSNGNIEKEGDYEKGIETGKWIYYDKSGALTSIIDNISGTDYKYTYYYSNGQPKSSGHIKNKKNIDKFVSYYTNGVIEKEIPLNDEEQLEGDWKTYYDNGQLNYVVKYVNGKIADGEQIYYYKSGGVKSKILYKGEKRNGDATEYYENGAVKLTGKYNMGDQVGNWKDYHLNGKLAAEYTYVNDQLEGSYKNYYDNGVLESESNYTKGEQKGVTKNYDTDGKLFAEYAESKGKIKKASYYDKNGKVIYEGDANKNTLKLLKYNAMGIKTEEGDVYKDLRSGTWSFYQDNGALNYVQTYDSKGKIDGKVEVFYVGGNIRKKYTMNSGEMDDYYVSYYINGNKFTEGYYVNGSMEGVWKEYYISGAIKEETYYLNNELTGVYKTFYPNGIINTAQEYKEGRFFKYALYDTTGKVIEIDTINMPMGKLNIKYKNGAEYMNYSYANGMKDGKQITYWGNKNIKNIREYKYGQMINSEYSYYPNGKLNAVYPYKYGELDSVYSVYYETTGGILHTKSFKNGEASGPEKYYFENGKIETQGENLHDDREGWFEYYAADGHLQYKLFYHLGVVLSYSYHDKDGKFVKEIPFNNAIGEFNCTFSNGNPSAKGSFVNGSRNGLYTKYYFNGKKAEDTKYTYGYLDGMSTEYYENGKIKSEVLYVSDSKNGIEKNYDDKGNLTMETTWVDDYKNGPQKIYKNGKLVKTILYEYDNTYDK